MAQAGWFDQPIGGNSMFIPSGPITPSGSLTGSEEIDEKPLLEELGIDFEHMKQKLVHVLNPRGQISKEVVDDRDMAGPLCAVLLFGACLMMTGRLHFGYIYGLSLIGSVSIYILLNLMAPSDIDMYQTTSVLGYCLMPIVGLAAVNIILSLQALYGAVLAMVAIAWSTYSATNMMIHIVSQEQEGAADRRLLIAYPLFLLYSCFVIITIF